MERLYEIHAGGDYDLIVVDTPPTRNALDFLDAPERMAEFFSSRLLRWLIVPYRSRLVNFASRPFYQVADRILGTQFLDDISQFFILFQTMYDGFIERAQAVGRLLADRRTTFIVVATLEAAPLHEAQVFVEELGRRDLHVGAVVLNKVLPDVPARSGRHELVPRSSRTLPRRSQTKLAGDPSLERNSSRAAVQGARRDRFQLSRLQPGRSARGRAARRDRAHARRARERPLLRIRRLRLSELAAASASDSGADGAVRSRCSTTTFTSGPTASATPRRRSSTLPEYCEIASVRGSDGDRAHRAPLQLRPGRSSAPGILGRRTRRRTRASMASYWDDHARADLDAYVECVLEAKAEGLPVVLGLEVDYYRGRMDEVEQPARRVSVRRASRIGPLDRRCGGSTT